MRVNRSGGPHEARRGDLDAVADRRKSPKLRRRSELQVKRHRALAHGALGNQRVPGDRFAQLDRDRAERHRMRTLGAVGKCLGRLGSRRAIGDVQQIDRGFLVGGRNIRKKGLGLLPDVHRRSGHQRIGRCAAGEEHDSHKHRDMRTTSQMSLIHVRRGSGSPSRIRCEKAGSRSAAFALVSIWLNLRSSSKGRRVSTMLRSYRRWSR